MLVGAAGSSPAPPLRGSVLERSFHSAALRGRLRLELYLPPGYAASTARYSVVYFLHGLPASPYAFRGIGAVAQALDRSRRRAILVAPQGARDGDDDPEYLDWGPGRNWETALGKELPRFVEALLGDRVVERLLPSDRPARRLRPRSRLAGRKPPRKRAQIYVGRGDARFRAENQRLHRELAAARVPHAFEVYPGAHEQTLWNAHARMWLRLALDHLTPAG